MPSSVTYARLSPTLARAAVDIAAKATTAVQVADLVTKVLAWQSKGYVSDTDIATISAALQSLDIDLSTLTPAQIAEYQSVIDSARHAGSKTISKSGVYHPLDDSLDYYGEVTVIADVVEKLINQNGTYSASDDGHDGYSSVTVSTVAYTHASASASFDSSFLTFGSEAGGEQ